MRFVHTVRTAAVLTAFLVAGTSLLTVVAVRTNQLRCLRVLTASMAPTVPAGSIVLGAPTTGTQLHVGELVMFAPPAPYRAPGGAPIVHRVFRITDDHRTTVITTKGDANPVADPWRLDATRTTFYQVRWHSLALGNILGRAHKWGPAALTALLALPLWLAAMRRLALGLPAPHRGQGRHRLT